ncbi:MAG: peptidoglycan-binding protein [Chloroflexota bacterium]
MRRIALSFMLSGLLMLPAVAHPQTAAAACVDVATGIVIVILNPVIGTILAVTCSPDTVTPDPCPITAVGATARRDDHGALVHEFDFRFTDYCGSVHIVGSYAERTGEVSERLTGDTGSEIHALWHCTGDPWVYTAGTRPSCSRMETILTGTHSAYSSGLISQSTYPLSAADLSDISRQSLNGQLQNAIRQLPPPPTAAPLTPVQPPVQPPRLLQTVRLGHTDAQMVVAVQYLLVHHGYTVSVDGDFGAQTDDAVRAFQASKGITVDGIVGRQTWEQLWVNLQVSRFGNAVRALQTLLNLRGHALAVDGLFGSQTDAAVRTFQQAQGLIVDGIVGPKTWEALCARIVRLRVP